MMLYGLSHHPHGVVKLRHLTADFIQLCRYGFQVLGNHILYHHIAPGNGGGAHKRPCFNLIGNNGIFCAVKFLYTSDTDNIRSGSLDICPHAV